MSQTLKIPIEKIKVPPIRASSVMDPDAKEFFDATVKEVGVIQDPVVRPLPDGTYELVAGLSRLKALAANNQTLIDVKVIKVNDLTSTIMHLAENVARGKADPVSIAQVLNKALNEGAKIPDLARALGKSETWIRRTLSLLELPYELHDALRAGRITPSHVYVAARMPTPEETFSALQTAERLEWPSSTLETYVNNRLEEIANAKHQAQEQGIPVAIPEANPLALIQFRQCLTCGYRKETSKISMTYVCEDCLTLIKYITSQLGSSDLAIQTIYAALQNYFSQQKKEELAEPKIKGAATQQ